ncbi:2-polyprenylphenol 6-hydroxylase [Gudongella oleilytica]|uniref:2-polyprenylphenol 6-hydroxylase n=1 Tax=Gudongella oleilytica TaxID=1582259 RepID=UPI002A370BD2|nr:2-polyprenylphenol 6-hydroxylase [Gudongella oleilytica]MDY0256396.1 2-polyprenylphenol 6-hydroxylase [Gudongella oleilytica]
MAVSKHRKLKRTTQIVKIFANHGFGALMDRLGILKYLKIEMQTKEYSERELSKLSIGERLRLSFEELGPTFIKLGQIMSTRPDLLPREIIHEMEKLQDAVAPFSISDVKQVIEFELGDKLENIFREFKEEPIAAASIGQVHRAKLLSGKDVVVKVQRPNIEKNIELDLGILKDLADFIDNRTKLGKLYSFSKMAEEFETTITNELDFRLEGENAETFKVNFKDEANVIVPDISWIHTTSRVLTMDEIKGTSLKNFEALDQLGLDKKIIARNLANSVLYQILRDGFFHGDPHPGNIMVLENNKIAFLDFGMIGQLSPHRKNQFLKMLMGITLKDSKLIIQAIVELDAISNSINMRKLGKDIDRLRDQVLSVPLSEIKIGEVFNEIFDLAFTYNMMIPGEFTMLAKSLITLEGLVEKLDPDLNILEIAEPIAGKLIFTLISPEKIGREILSGAMDYGNLVRKFPSVFLNFLGKIEHDDFTIQIKVKEAERYAQKIDRSFSRLSISIVFLSLSIVIAGTIIGLSLIGMEAADFIMVLSMILKGSLFLAAITFAALIIAILRSKRT